MIFLLLSIIILLLWSFFIVRSIVFCYLGIHQRIALYKSYLLLLLLVYNYDLFSWYDLLSAVTLVYTREWRYTKVTYYYYDDLISSYDPLSAVTLVYTREWRPKVTYYYYDDPFSSYDPLSTVALELYFFIVRSIVCCCLGITFLHPMIHCLLLPWYYIFSSYDPLSGVALVLYFFIVWSIVCCCLGSIFFHGTIHCLQLPWYYIFFIVWSIVCCCLGIIFFSSCDPLSAVALVLFFFHRVIHCLLLPWYYIFFSSYDPLSAVALVLHFFSSYDPLSVVACRRTSLPLISHDAQEVHLPPPPLRLPQQQPAPRLRHA